MCPQRMVRLYFKDGDYMDVPENSAEAHYYESDPEYDRTEEIDDDELEETNDETPES